MNESKKRILILGAQGQLAYDLMEIFKADSYECVGLSRKEFEAGVDIIDEKLEPYYGFDYIINCLAYHKVDECESNQRLSYLINAEFVLNLGQFCDKNELTLFHFSTDYVFDGFKTEPYLETDLTNPINVYGQSKGEGERLLDENCGRYFIFRVSSLFGVKPTHDPNINFVEKMLKAANNKIPLKVIDDQIMSPTYCADVANAVKYFIDNDISDYGIFHANNTGQTSWFDFAEEIFRITDAKADLTPVTYTEFHTKAKRPQYCSLDNSKLKTYIDMPGWKTALREYLDKKGYIKK